MSKANQHSVDVYTLPEPGQLVEVRRRQWVVRNVTDSRICDGKPAQHLAELASIDEDKPGELLNVVWEIELGAKIIENAGLPIVEHFGPELEARHRRPYDTPDQFDAFLDAVRWGAVTNADRKQLAAPFRSGIAIEDYQLDPVVRSLDMAHVNLLIADDVGLGKTIEAGLVIQEMIVRHRARTVIIVCPASLQIKWQTEMREKFGLEFKIVDTAYLRELRRKRGIHVNPWTASPRLITSMDWAKNGEGLRLLRQILPEKPEYPQPFDILVVDEAHNVAPTRLSNYCTESQRTHLVRMLAPHFAHHLFLSATPHNGYPESFSALLEILDPQRFARNVMPDQKQLFRIMVRRLKEEIPQAGFARRDLKTLTVRYTDEEKNIHKLLNDYVNLRTQKAAGSPFDFGTTFVNSLLKKRLFSSPQAFWSTLEKHAESLKNKQNYSEQQLRRAINRTTEDYADDERRHQDQDEAVEMASQTAPVLDDAEAKILKQLLAKAKKCATSTDAKAKAIIAWLNSHLKDTQGRYNDERVILFTEYRDTQTWLYNILQTPAHGFGGYNDAKQPYIKMLNGSMNSDEREAVKAAFQASPAISGVRILIATDAAAEGIDLQNHCHYMIHLEIPWNPNIMEQRNGRIDRHGQTHPTVEIWHPVGEHCDLSKVAYTKASDLDGDLEYLMRAAIKVNAIRHDLGSMGDVLERQIEEGMLNLRNRFDDNPMPIRREQARMLLKEERNLNARIAELHKTLLETRDACHLTPEHVRRAVDVALALAGKPPLIPTDDSEIFDMPFLDGSWSRAREGLEHPFTHAPRSVTFNHALAQGRDDLVLIHLNHPLVQMSLRLLREELWSQLDIRRINRVSVRRVPRQFLKANAVVVWSRLVITGDDQQRLHEELTTAGGYLRTDSFRRFDKRQELDEALSHSEPFDPSESVFNMFAESYERNANDIYAACCARSREKLNALTNKLDSACSHEINDITQILNELADNLRKELDMHPIEQMTQPYLPGLSPEESDQKKRDYESLRARLDRIPSEIEEETRLIQKHYAHPTDRTFPAGVVFLIPM